MYLRSGKVIDTNTETTPSGTTTTNNTKATATKMRRRSPRIQERLMSSSVETNEIVGRSHSMVLRSSKK
jgi:hypothetical protein